ncbi:hypothetical protein L2747_16725 [Shewanella marinintestina]|uniref:hypothetical protein n=1 Tax=Shewanella marinintestina TaxID=190305 RepID=UPI002010B0B9|nr:hypothetical protein [Shewanella marinintestina]MCL1147651.1 hypothetical protein [Shewanella marinintestina]
MIKIVILIITCFGLSACNPSENASKDISADAKPSLRTPELSSLGFLNAVYNDKDIEKAKFYVDEPLKELLGHYYIAAAVQRNMLNLSMAHVELEVDEIDIDFFRKFTDDVTVIVKMKGLRGGQHWVDDRTLRLNKRNGNWIIVEIMPEKRQVNG